MSSGNEEAGENFMFTKREGALKVVEWRWVREVAKDWRCAGERGAEWVMW